MAERMPQMPLTSMGAAAVQLHEVFTAYLAAGFSRKEALYLVGLIVTTSTTGRAPEQP